MKHPPSICLLSPFPSPAQAAAESTWVFRFGVMISINASLLAFLHRFLHVLFTAARGKYPDPLTYP
jgi:hypothetical protein